MKLSKTSEYTLRLLSYMINSGYDVFPAGLLVKELNIPNKYLRNIMTNISKKGFIKSLRGKHGGYVLDDNARKTTLWEIIDSVDGIEHYTGCILGFKECSDENPCSLHELYNPIKNQLVYFLNTTTISDLKNNQINKF